MPRGEGSADSMPADRRAVDRDESLTELCREAVERLAAKLPGAQVYCHLLVRDALRAVAAEGGLRMIYEVRRDQGGICWRAAETQKPQLVEDVRRDPDYMTTDENVRSEVAAPVAGPDGTLLVLDAEFVDRTFTQEESEAVLAEAARLEAELSRVANL
ncbi:MAG TPA: GAF domain-containing protein [Gaiellaceae bacterium]|nr:GAF domain-containing protein [Gaiellaceae bacterium]